MTLAILAGALSGFLTTAIFHIAMGIVVGASR